jgi:hypothetical protein
MSDNIRIGEIGDTWLMDIDKIIEKVRDWVNRVLDALFGPEVQPEVEPIPIPVKDPRYPR